MSEHTEAAPRPPSSAQPAAAVRRRSQGELVLRRFLRHKAAVTSLVLFVAVVLLAFAGGALWRYDYADITSAVSQPPSLEHPFGTDNLGHDTFAQVLRGTQRSVEIALLIAFLAGLVGTLWGAFSGYYRGITDSVMMRIADLVLTLPLLAVAAVLTRATNGSWWFVALVIAALQWAYVSRVVRGVVLSLREKEYIEASRALGATDRWIIFRHLIPNALGPIIVNVTILVAAAILVETALSFLGLGVQPPDTSLGLLVSEADTAVSTRPWLFYFPGAFIVVIALSINFIGDGLRDAFDPTQRKARS
ncbi:ABC transporter permease [Nonomuraea longispora]|uniref:Oligopeptide transport system permease protein OppC n=1 Tax=Nonomuraea longispora TaxID=1848320 RepID=A0A4R4NKZ6_9ACTN|nr:ABC transporter permease [Nonomuraea longispora]TDC08400.1 ABC transporter permease [Nonomuraea longispora]